ncbi:hypothetical protein [Phytohabitans rumicis]|uniref:hypothetical protein n=1 Tax=Phytohabitans rumicis TaxID=1076125 RepID=UPI00156403B1|nr:hypothetical protein [Phytohabitans rumicis]
MVLAAIVAGALLRYADRYATNDEFADQFRGWVAVAVLSLGIWSALFTRGLSTVHEFRRMWPRGRVWWTWHFGAYALLVASVLAMLTLNNAGEKIVVPIDGFPTITRTLVLVAATAAAPWVLTVWLAHEQLRILRAEVDKVRPPELIEELTVDKLDGAAISAAVTHSLAVWKVIERCTLSLALLVSTAVFLSGALRLALINSRALADDVFPASAVLSYGAFFAAVLALAVVPLVLAWRSHAFRLVEAALGEPRHGIPDQTWLDGRERLEARLRLDTNVLRSPITAVSVASPLVTAVLAALVPNA